VRLAQFGALPRIRVGDAVAVARDRRLMLGLFLDRLHALCAEPASTGAAAHPELALQNLMGCNSKRAPSVGGANEGAPRLAGTCDGRMK